MRKRTFGGVGEGLQIGDLVIGSALCQHDFDLAVFGYAKGIHLLIRFNRRYIMMLSVMIGGYAKACTEIEHL